MIHNVGQDTHVVEGEIVNARYATVSQDATQIGAALNSFSFR